MNKSSRISLAIPLGACSPSRGTAFEHWPSRRRRKEDGRSRATSTAIGDDMDLATTARQ